MMKRNLMVIGLAVLLSACGFKLQGSSEEKFALHELDVQARDAYGEMVREVRQALKVRGVTVTAAAPYQLHLAREQSSQRAASYTSAARTAEYEKTLSLDYQIRTADNLLLLSSRLEVQRIYVQDGNNLVGSEQEAAQVQREMRRDLVQRLMQQLQVISVPQLETLQARAEEKARREAQALEDARRSEAATPQQSPLLLPLNTQ